MEDLQSERRAHIRAILSNGGYLQGDKTMEARRTELDQINEHYDKAVMKVMDPWRAYREQREFEENPLFAAGMRGLDRLKWDLQAGQVAAAQLREQGF